MVELSQFIAVDIATDLNACIWQQHTIGWWCLVWDESNRASYPSDIWNSLESSDWIRVNSVDGNRNDWLLSVWTIQNLNKIFSYMWHHRPSDCNVLVIGHAPAKIFLVESMIVAARWQWCEWGWLVYLLETEPVCSKHDHGRRELHVR